MPFTFHCAIDGCWVVALMLSHSHVFTCGGAKQVNDNECPKFSCVIEKTGKRLIDRGFCAWFWQCCDRKLSSTQEVTKCDHLWSSVTRLWSQFEFSESCPECHEMQNRSNTECPVTMCDHLWPSVTRFWSQFEFFESCSECHEMQNRSNTECLVTCNHLIELWPPVTIGASPF